MKPQQTEDLGDKVANRLWSWHAHRVTVSSYTYLAIRAAQVNGPPLCPPSLRLRDSSAVGFFLLLPLGGRVSLH